MPHSVSHFTLSTPRMLIKKASSLKFIPYPCRQPSRSLCPRLHSTPLQKGVTFNEQHPLWQRRERELRCIGGKNPLTPPFMAEHKWSEWGKEGAEHTMLIISKRRTDGRRLSRRPQSSISPPPPPVMLTATAAALSPFRPFPSFLPSLMMLFSRTMGQAWKMSDGLDRFVRNNSDDSPNSAAKLRGLGMENAGRGSCGRRRRAQSGQNFRNFDRSDRKIRMYYVRPRRREREERGHFLGGKP